MLVILFVALDIFPLIDGSGQVHHAQRKLDLELHNACSPSFTLQQPPPSFFSDIGKEHTLVLYYTKGRGFLHIL